MVHVIVTAGIWQVWCWVGLMSGGFGLRLVLNQGVWLWVGLALGGCGNGWVCCWYWEDLVLGGFGVNLGWVVEVAK